MRLVVIASLLCFCSAIETFRVPVDQLQDSLSCRLSVGVPGTYPRDSNIKYYAEFDIPPLPKNFSSRQTY